VYYRIVSLRAADGRSPLGNAQEMGLCRGTHQFYTAYTLLLYLEIRESTGWCDCGVSC
jgi:hypothetical protein